MKAFSCWFLLVFLALKVYSSQFQNASGTYQCYYRCQSCTDTSSTSCTSCYANYILSNSSCVPCADNCISCVAATGLCQTCASQFYLSQSTWTCKSCPVGAETCTFSAIQQCLSGYYLTNSICQFCISNCQTCSDAYTCSVCNSGYYLTSQQTCLPCSGDYCSSCDQSGDCTLCSNNRYGSTCNQSCPSFCQICDSSACYQCDSGYYQTTSGTCQALSVTCDSGLDPFNCLACIQDIAFLDGVTCYPYTSVHLTNKQIYMKPLNEISSFSGSLAYCGNYWLSKDKEFIQISLNIMPSYKLRLKIQILTHVNITSTIKIHSDNLQEVFIGNITSTYEYSCFNDSWVFTNFQTSFTPIFSTANSYQSMILVVEGSNSIGVSQVLIEEYLCLVSNCGLCLSAYSCTQCISPYLLQNNKCLSQCSSGYYYTQLLMTCTLSCPTYYFPNLADYSCTSCISPCKTCKSATQCSSCLAGWFLLNNNCLVSCPSGYFKSTIQNTCTSCQYPCATCSSSATNCTSCSLGFLDTTSGRCVMQCSNGFFSNFSAITCSNCSAECLTCEFSPDYCTSCSPPYFLNPNSTCLSSCDSTYAANSVTNTCQKCLYPCRTCNGTASNCSTCYSGYLQGSSCVSTCSVGFYSDFQLKQCLACQNSCRTCVSKIQCTSCMTGYYYSSSSQSCSLTCSNNSFEDTNFTCTLCRSPCKQCTNLTYCLSCQGYLFVFNSGACLLSCPKGTFVVLDETTNQKYCKQCGINCSVCISSSICITCSQSSLYQGSCLNNCPNTTYEWNGVCNNCTYPCRTCQASDMCLSCTVGFYFYSQTNSCLRICPSGFYASGSNCQPCNPICQLCNDGSINCLSCSNGYYKNSSGACSSSCGYGQYAYAIQSVCKKCVSPCRECLSSSLCVSCNTSSTYPYLFRKNCVASCPNGYFADNSSLCQLCSSNCLYCSKAYDNCTQCGGNHYLFVNSSNRCVQNCPDRYYPNSAAQCTSCLSPCLLCVSQSNCLSCVSNSYFFFNGNCLAACPFGYYSYSVNNTNICQPCDLSCLQCLGSSLNCSFCSSGLFLQTSNVSNNSFQCLSSCPTLYYQDVVNQICSACTSPCLACYSASRCISCLSGYMLQFDICLLTCNSGYYAEGFICKPCVSPCATCSSNTSCLSCVSNYYLQQNQTKCLNQCPSSTYAFETSNGDLQCLSCPTSCLECYDSISCRSCQTNSSLPYLQGTVCQATCTDGYYAINGSLTCQWCGWGCLTCDSAGVCSQCSNSYLYGGVCQTQCPIGYYGSISFTCQACISPCYDCYNAANCEYCIQGYYLYLTHCLKTCPQNQWAVVSLGICNSTCPINYFKVISNRSCVVSCSAYYDSDGNCVDICPSQLMANQTFGCQACDTADCSKKLFYQLMTLQKNGYQFLVMIFSLPIDSLNYFSLQSITLSLEPSVVIDPSQLHLSGLRNLMETVSITNSVSIIEKSSYFIILQVDLQNYGDVFTGIFSLTVKDLNSLTVGGYPLQTQNATATLDEYQANSGGKVAEYFGWIISILLLLTFVINFVCGSQRNVMLAVDGIQTIHVLFYLSVWNHPLFENFMIGLRLSTLRQLLTNFGMIQKLWNCPPKYILLFGYCNTLLQLVLPIIAIVILIGIAFACKFITFLDGKHNFFWNHANSIWWLVGMSLGISAFNGLSNAESGPFLISVVVCACFLIFSLIIGFKIVQNVYSNSYAESCFFWDLKKKKAQHILSNLHSLLLVVRRIVIVIAVSLGYSNPLSSLFVVTLLTICIFSNIIINRPFKNYGMMVGAAELLFGIILVLLQMYIVNTARLSNPVWNGFGYTIFLFVLIYVIILLLLGIKQTFKTVKKMYFKSKQSNKSQKKKSIKENLIQTEKKQKIKDDQDHEQFQKEGYKIGNETQNPLIKAQLRSKRSPSSHIFSEHGREFQNEVAPPKLLKIEKDSQEYKSIKKIQNL